MRLGANAFDFKGMQGTAGPVCQPAAFSLCAGRGDPGDGGIGALATHLSTCIHLHLKQERCTIQGLSETHWQTPC